MADKTGDAWKALFEKHPDIVSEAERLGICKVSARQIKEFREPRLMTKHDSLSGVPAPLKKRRLNVLPISRKEYVLGDFQVFADLPDLSNERPKFFELPDLETLDVEQISSESNAINALQITGILDDFLGDGSPVQETFNGRMGTGDFDFSIERANETLVDVSVRGAQLEIDGGFENDESVVIMEAKNVLYPDFQVRQLYYPFRKYREIVKRKKLRLVFSQYTNLRYNLFEFGFEDPLDYSSLVYLRGGSYTLEDTSITSDDVDDVWSRTTVVTNDAMEISNVPFIQADEVDRVISICEYLQGCPDGVTTDELTEFMGLADRQTSYYSAAGEYLGLIDRSLRGTARLTGHGLKLMSLGYRERMLGIAGLMFRHEIFHRLYGQSRLGKWPEKSDVTKLMLELNVCSDGSTLGRRAQSVLAWLKWLRFELPDAD